MSILEELYNGNITPSEKMVKKDGEYHKISGDLVELIDKLMPTLSDEQKALCEKINEKIWIMAGISQKESFIEGVRLGAGLVFEIGNYESENFEYISHYSINY